MSLSIMRCVVGLGLVLSCTLATAGGVDEDLREAAKLHRHGETARAVAIWQSWAAKGELDAAYNLAVIHQHGDGVPVDYAKALHWYRQAAEGGDKASQFQIGLMYQTGLGVEADTTVAHRWFTRHRRDHLHHAHEPQMVAWRAQALALIEARDRREQAVASAVDAAQVLADLKRRAGMSEATPALAAAPAMISTR